MQKIINVNLKPHGCNPDKVVIVISLENGEIVFNADRINVTASRDLPNVLDMRNPVTFWQNS